VHSNTYCIAFSEGALNVIVHFRTISNQSGEAREIGDGRENKSNTLAS
jgi:hypothetical protein